MTSKNSICIRCQNLEESNGFVITRNGDYYMISVCLCGGKNAGNRKKCKRFRASKETVVSERMRLFEKMANTHGGDNNG